MKGTPPFASLQPGPGFRIRREVLRVRDGILGRLEEFSTPDISDQLNRLFSLDSRIKLQTATGQRMCGPVTTVQLFPGDNLMVHKALDIAKPGDIVAVAGGGVNAVLGGMVCAKAKHRGIKGFVVDGLIRDLPEIEEVGMPVFARGTTPLGPLHRGPGEINYPIACGGAVVNPGDVIVADAAGVVVVPREAIDTLLERLGEHEVRTAEYQERVRRNDFSNEWVDRLLEEQGCWIT